MGMDPRKVLRDPISATAAHGLSGQPSLSYKTPMDGPSPRDPHTAAASDSSSPALPQKHHFLTHGRPRLDRQPQQSGERRRRQVPCNYSIHRTASTTATLNKTPRQTPLRRGPSHQTPCGLRLCLFFSLVCPSPLSRYTLPL